jgi:hypothetical protein
MAAYLGVHAWKAGADCVVVPRSALEAWLDLQRFKRARLDWFISDAEPWFPHSSTYFYSHSRSFSSVYLSRKALPDGTGAMSDADRLEWLRGEGLVGYIYARQTTAEAIERAAVHELSDIATGLSDLRHFSANTK